MGLSLTGASDKKNGGYLAGMAPFVRIREDAERANQDEVDKLSKVHRVIVVPEIFGKSELIRSSTYPGNSRGNPGGLNSPCNKFTEVVLIHRVPSRPSKFHQSQE